MCCSSHITILDLETKISRSDSGRPLCLRVAYRCVCQRTFWFTPFDLPRADCEKSVTHREFHKFLR